MSSTAAQNAIAPIGRKAAIIIRTPDDSTHLRTSCYGGQAHDALRASAFALCATADNQREPEPTNLTNLRTLEPPNPRTLRTLRTPRTLPRHIACTELRHGYSKNLTPGILCACDFARDRGFAYRGMRWQRRQSHRPGRRRGTEYADAGDHQWECAGRRRDREYRRSLTARGCRERRCAERNGQLLVRADRGRIRSTR